MNPHLNHNQNQKEKIMLDINEILKFLPHRYPFLLVDRVIELELKRKIVAIKNVTMNEPFFNGHFPSAPIMPGVLIMESLAQTAGILCLKSLEPMTCNKVYLMSMDRVKFRRPVIPGDQLKLIVQTTNIHKHGWKFKGEAFVDEKLAAEGEFLATVVEE
jgi:beta-hydroxyacyl-ACP dehydratase FabZ